MGFFGVFVKQKTDRLLYTLIFHTIPNNLTMDHLEGLSRNEATCNYFLISHCPAYLSWCVPS
jgi:hypothetical protein